MCPTIGYAFLATIDTLKIAKDLKAGGMPQRQSEAVAQAIGSLGIGPIMRDLDVLKAITGIVMVLTLAMLWQVFSLRGDVAARFGSLGERVARIEACDAAPK